MILKTPPRQLAILKRATQRAVFISLVCYYNKSILLYSSTEQLHIEKLHRYIQPCWLQVSLYWKTRNVYINQLEPMFVPQMRKNVADKVPWSVH